MSEDWANQIAEQLLDRKLRQTGICLILGGVDTGKTTLAATLASLWTSSGPVGVIDADIGQSHIGPPTTVGWAVVDKPEFDFGQLTPGGISFVGDVTPVGHLLQLTAALAQSVRQVSKITERIIIDTPGFVVGPAASALWWTVQGIVQPDVILAVQKGNELNVVLGGMEHLGSQIERLTSPPPIPGKSPEVRRRHRQSRFRTYFQNARSYHIDLKCTTIQTTRNLSTGNLVSRIVGLRDNEGTDRAIGIIDQWKGDKGTVVVRAPQLDIDRIRCLVVGDIVIDIV